jgi:hypothetical protein
MPAVEPYPGLTHSISYVYSIFFVYKLKYSPVPSSSNTFVVYLLFYHACTMWSKSSKIFAENHYYDLSFTNIVPVFLGILIVLAVINIKHEENSLYFSGKGRVFTWHCVRPGICNISENACTDIHKNWLCRSKLIFSKFILFCEISVKMTAFWDIVPCSLVELVQASCFVFTLFRFVSTK